MKRFMIFDVDGTLNQTDLYGPEEIMEATVVVQTPVEILNAAEKIFG